VVGLVLTAGRVIRWWWLAEQTRLRSLAVISGDSREWRSLHKDAKNSRRDRGLVLLAAAFAVPLAATLLWKFAPWWGWAVLAAGVLLPCFRAGRPADGGASPRPRPGSAPSTPTSYWAYYAAGLTLTSPASRSFGAPCPDGTGRGAGRLPPAGQGCDAGATGDRVRP
jgi:hypothetical protein